MSTAAEHWSERLGAWAIPQPILDAAPESPYGFPAELFRRRAQRSAYAAPGPTTERALAALPEGGSVLDVGVGGGATSLPLGAHASRLTGVDQQADMLADFEAAAGDAGVAATTVRGGWPEVAGDVPKADVAICGHVAYNVPHLAPFVAALDSHAHRRVVMELTDHHPLQWMNDLWLTFHDVVRPMEPSYADALAVLQELGFTPQVETVTHAGDPAVGGFAERAAAVALVRRRLCLLAERDAEIAEALGDRLIERDGLWAAGPTRRVVATIWWDVA